MTPESSTRHNASDILHAACQLTTSEVKHDVKHRHLEKALVTSDR
jgi:hypothetical protein